MMDVWSFACLVIEVFTGMVPFHHLVNDGAVIIDILVNNRHPPRPAALPSSRLLSDTLWQLMERSWAPEPSDRPSMRISLSLASISQRSPVSWSYLFQPV